jgi:glycosyltransferase involved in cell wall biosynthesis
MIIFIHNRYRTVGGEERVVEHLLSLVSKHLRLPVQLVVRDSNEISRRSAAASLLTGGSMPPELRALLSGRGSESPAIVHAHNLNPAFGWRTLARARALGAKTVVHLHQFRLVCAIGVCFRDGRECTSCHSRNTLPGVLHRCRGDVAQAITYAAALSLSQRKVIENADALIVPSEFARRRLLALGVQLPLQRVHVLAPPLLCLQGPLPSSRPLYASCAEDHPCALDLQGQPAAGAQPAARRRLARAAEISASGCALLVSRLEPQKGVHVAIQACVQAGMPLLVAGDGPLLHQLRRVGRVVRFSGK